MARHINRGYEVSGYGIGSLIPVTQVEYDAIPGAESDNNFYFIYDSGVIRYNSYVFGTPGVREKSIKVALISHSDYINLPASEKEAEILYMLEDREVLIYKGRIFGDILVNEGEYERTIFYQWMEKLTEYQETITALQTQVAELQAKVDSMAPEHLTAEQLQDKIDEGTYVPGKVYIVR